MGATLNGATARHNGSNTPRTEVNGIVESAGMGSSPQPTNVEEMFMEMTNEDPDGHVSETVDLVDGAATEAGMLGDDDADAGASAFPPSTLEHHTSQASEALEMIGGVVEGQGGTNGVSVDGDEDGDDDHDQEVFDEFFNGGDA